MTLARFCNLPIGSKEIIEAFYNDVKNIKIYIQTKSSEGLETELYHVIFKINFESTAAWKKHLPCYNFDAIDDPKWEEEYNSAKFILVKSKGIVEKSNKMTLAWFCIHPNGKEGIIDAFYNHVTNINIYLHKESCEKLKPGHYHIIFKIDLKATNAWIKYLPTYHFGALYNSSDGAKNYLNSTCTFVRGKGTV